MFKGLKKFNTIMGVIGIAVLLICKYDLDDKLMEKVEPLLLKLAQKKAAKQA